MSDNKEQKSFWSTFPGILTGCAAIMTAIGGLITALYAAGLLSTLTPRSVTPVSATALSTAAPTGKPNWVVLFEYRFAPRFWSVGNHQYAIESICPNIKDGNGSWTNTFQVSEDAQLLPDNLYLRFAGVKSAPMGAAPSISKIHPAQATIALFGLVGMTQADAEQASKNCRVTIKWDSNSSQLIPRTPYQEP